MLSTASANVRRFAAVKDDLVLSSWTQGFAAVAADSFIADGTSYVATASPLVGGAIYRVNNDGSIVPLAQIAGPRVGVVGFGARSAWCFLFIAQTGSSCLACLNGQQFAIVQNVSLPSGATTAAVFREVDPVDSVVTAHIISTGASGSTSVQRFESNLLLRQVYQVQTQAAQTWKLVAP